MKLINYLKLVFRPSELLNQYEAMEEALVEYQAELETCRDLWSEELAKAKIAFSNAHHQQHYVTLVHIINDLGYEVMPEEHGITLIPHSMDGEGRHATFKEVH